MKPIRALLRLCLLVNYKTSLCGGAALLLTAGLAVANYQSGAMLVLCLILALLGTGLLLAKDATTAINVPGALPPDKPSNVLRSE